MLRAAYHLLIEKAGFVDGGLLFYDSYYHFAFVEEIRRSGSFLFFHNPFGSFDQLPKLINLYSSILALFYPIYTGRLFFFDVTVGSLGIFTVAFFLLKIMPRLDWKEKVIVLFGGGIGFVLAELGQVDRNRMVVSGFWGLNFLLNQISTPEILYHALFFVGLWALLSNKSVLTICTAVMLSVLHPFTAITFGIAVGAWCVHEVVFCRKNPISLPILLGITSATISICIPIIIFDVLYPLFSADAKYFKDVYDQTRFVIEPHIYFSTLAVPLLMIFIGWRGKQSLSILRNKKMFVFICVTIFCMVMNLSYLFTHDIVQPAHWSRVYPYVFLIGIAVYQFSTLPLKRRIIVNSLVWIIMAIALLDSGLALKNIYNFFIMRPRTSLMLTHEQSDVIQKLRNSTAGDIMYLRNCESSDVNGDLEYTIMSLTRHKAPVGHLYFSPHRKEWEKNSFLCKNNYHVSPEIFSDYNFILFDTSLNQKLSIYEPIKLAEVLYAGKDLTLVQLSEKAYKKK